MSWVQSSNGNGRPVESRPRIPAIPRRAAGGPSGQPFAVHRFRRRSALGGLAITAAAAGSTMLAAACGSKNGTGGNQAPATAKQAGQPKPGGEVNFSMQIDPFDYDPTGKPLQNGPIIELAYNALLTAKMGPDVTYSDLVLAPALADKWEAPDGATYTFHLQPGAKWQNLPPVNGRDVTSEDVKWSMEYQSRTGRLSKQSNPKLAPSLNDSYYVGLDKIETPDPATVVIHFSSPFVPFINYMALERDAILAHEVFDQDGNFTSHLVGTGAWQLDTTASKPGTRWVMKKNPTYFKKGLPYIDQVNFLIIPDEATNVAAFRSKQLDWLKNTYITPATVSQIQKENPDAVIYEYADTSGGLLFEYVPKPPLNDPRIRKAISLSVDRDAFMKAFFGGKGRWALAGGTLDLFTDEEVHRMIKYDPAQAKQLVSEAGYPNGVPIEFHYPGTSRGQVYASQVQLIQAQLKQGNLNVSLKVEDEATFSKNQRSGDFQLDYEGKQIVGDVDSYVVYNWDSTSFGNFGKVADPKLDAMLDQQRREVDKTKRRQVLRQIGQYITDNAYYTSFAWGVGQYAWQKYLKNFTPNVAHYGTSLSDTSWLDK